MEALQLLAKFAWTADLERCEREGCDGLLDEDVAQLMGVKRKRPSSKEYMYVGEPPRSKRSRCSGVSQASGGKSRVTPGSSQEEAIVIDDDEDLEEIEAAPLQSAEDALRPSRGLDCDIPEHSVPLPPEVRLAMTRRSHAFYLGCRVDLERICFGIRDADLSIQGRTSVMLRMVEPKVSVEIFECGFVRLHLNDLDFAVVTRTARKIARLVQKCGHSTVKPTALTQRTLLAQFEMPFPVRIDALAEKWSRHAMYESNIFNGAVFWMASPRCTLKVTVTGNVTIGGGASFTGEDAREALRRVYPILRDFSQ